MTEWEKLQRGQIYNDFDDDLFRRRIAAKKLFRAYNRTEDEDTGTREELLRRLIRHVGRGVWIEPEFRCEYGQNISIEDDVYINFGCVILDCAEVVIGAHALIGPNVGIYPVNHALDADERARGVCCGRPVQIGQNVWIGGSVTILSGVTIGDNAVIGAGSVVTQNINANTLAYGVPCREIRKL